VPIPLFLIVPENEDRESLPPKRQQNRETLQQLRILKRRKRRRSRHSTPELRVPTSLCILRNNCCTVRTAIR
jgi:hypothetical protein